MGVWNLFCAILLLGSFGFGNSQRKQGRNIAVGSEGKTPANFDCPEEFGYYPHPTDCTQYYVCVFGGALLESCTGGLMYSHELQTCDWPRNVGCDGLDGVSVSSPGGDVRVSVQPARSSAPETRVRYTVVPTAQPQPVVSSRGQSRQLHATVHERVHERERVHSQDIITKNERKLQQQQQQQLYADAEDVLPPAEEIENDRQQRVYRGQPSTIGQVQRDRDGLRHTNAIPSSSRAEKIGVISFGTQQQQPVQQYRNDTLYIFNSLTDDLTAKRRRKRQTRRRLAPIDLVATADSSISWTRHVPVPHVIYHPQQSQQQVQQQLKQTYQNHRLNAMDLQPPPQLRFKPQQAEYSAILSGDQTEFQPFAPNPLTYKTQPISGLHTLKPNPYVLPKIVKPAGLYQYFKTDPRSQFPHEQNENYSYFKLGSAVTTPPSVVYAPSNQAKITQAYYQPNHQPQPQVQYQNQFRPITNPPSHIEYVNNQNKPVPEHQEPPRQNHDNEPEKESVPLNHKPEESEDEEDEDKDEQVNEGNEEESPEIKPEFPSPPPFFFKSTNKYENIENPFADPDFDFDKFISKLKGQENHKQITTEAKFQMIASQNDSKQKVSHSKVTPNIDLRTPVAFSSPPNKKKVNVKPIPEDDYYYDDEEEEIYEKLKKPYVKHEHEAPTKISSTTKAYSPINKNHSPSSHQVNVQNNKKIVNSHLSSAVTLRTEEKKSKPSKDKEHDEIAHQNVKPEDDEYEYYDDYDYDSEEQKDEKYEQPQIKKPLPISTTPKSVNIKHINPPKITNRTITNHKARPVSYETIIYQNKSQNHPALKGTKYIEKLKENRPSPSQTVHHKLNSSSPRMTETTHKITTIKFPNLQTTRLLTTTLRPRDRDSTTRKSNTNSSRLEESSVSTQSHSIGTAQSTPSGRTLYNGSQHYDPSQYDPYYTLYEDDVELYRDVDYTPQQQYTSSRAQPQQVYRGTPAPIAVPVQSTVQEETVPQRNSAYYSTQAQDVYSAAQDYHEDNYNTQVDDQTNYRQSSRQPSRGDRNELSYYVESTPKTTTTIRTTTTTTTTTTPRPIPVQKQSVVPSRSPIIAANQTRPQSIIITLSATPGQNSNATQSLIATTTTETNNVTDSSTSTPKPASHFISLNTGFNLRQTDLTPVTYKPHFTQTSSTTDSSDAVANRPAPFSLTKLPDSDTKSVIFRLSSRLSALSSNISETESQASILHVRSTATESPNKREIISDESKFAAAHVKTTDSTHVVPTTYSPSKAVLASILPKHSDNDSIKNSDKDDPTEEILVSILPKKTIIVNSDTKSNTESTSNHQRKSVTVIDRTRFENNDKPVKTVIRKLPLKVESTTPSSSTERTKGERKIISKIHFGIPQTYTNPEKINNLATTPSSFSSTTDFEDYSNSQESQSEKSNLYRNFPESKRPITAHYITTDLTTSQRPHFRFSNPVTSTERSVKYTPSTTEESLSIENVHSSEEVASSHRPRTRFSFNSRPVSTTERGNSVKYTPNTFDSEYIDSIDDQNANSKSHSRFSFNYNLNPTTERGNYVKYTSSTTEKPSSTENTNSEEEFSSSRKPNSKFAFNLNVNPTTHRSNYVKYTVSTTEKSSTTENTDSGDEVNYNNDRPEPRFSFNSNFNPTIDKKIVKNTSRSTTDKPSTENTDTAEEISNNVKLHSRFSFNSNFNQPIPRKIVKYTTSTTEKPSTENIDSAEKFSSTERPRFPFNSNFEPTIERKPYAKYKFSTTDKPNLEYIDSKEDFSSNEKPNFRYSFQLKSTTEHENNIKHTSSIAELSARADNEEGSDSQKPNNKYSIISNSASTSEDGTSDQYATSTTEKSFDISSNNPVVIINRKPVFRFIYNAGPTTTTEHASFVVNSTTEKDDMNVSLEKLKPSFTASRNIPSTIALTSTSRPLYQISTTTTERPSTVKYVPSSTTSTSTTFRYSTTTTSTTSSTTTSTTVKSEEKNKNSFIPDRATEKYRFVESSSEVSDTDDKIRSQLFVNRNAKPFRATAELPTVSEILATQDEPRKKEVDKPPTYKPKPFSLTDANPNRNRTSADASRNVTLPVRLSRVNTAIKSLTAFGGTRRNSQTPKCNENQTTPDTKCNEIQKQRTSTRGRGSAHYSSAGAGDNIAVNVNRGTPATPRSRPTLKPSTSIVSKAAEYVDIYRYPPTRPEPIYPQPQVDKTAAKCRKDVCLLPDCSCGGKEIPGDIPVEEVPQIVLITFDDAVNDLNRGIYSELFEQGRTNPNGCPISATFYVSHEWTDYSQVQNLYADGHELASHTVSHSFGEQFSQKKWNREVAGQREILAAYGGVHLEDVRGMRAPFLSVGGNKMFKMLYDSNFTYDSSLPVYENRPPSWPYTLDYKLFHDCMIPPCPTRSYPGVWEVPMVMWQDLNGGRCSMGDACSNPPDSDGVYKMLMKNFERHYTTNRAPFGLFYHAAWFTQPHHKEGFIKFLDFLVSKDDVFMTTNWQAIQWVRDPTPLNRIRNFPGFQCNYADRPKRCNNPKVCNLWHKSGVRYMKTCQPCPDIYPWTGKTGIRSSRIDNDIED